MGHAINLVRTQRNMEYDWNSLVELRDKSRPTFDSNVLDERKVVLNLVLESLDV